MKSINARRFYDLYTSNTKDNSYGAGAFDLVRSSSPDFRGTPKQCLAEIAEFRRISGGCYTSAVVIDPKTGDEWSFDDVQFALQIAGCRS